MPGLAQRNNEQFSNNAYLVSSANGFWSKHSDDVSYNQLQKVPQFSFFLFYFDLILFVVWADRKLDWIIVLKLNLELIY